jgi:hypothetical protein
MFFGDYSKKKHPAIGNPGGTQLTSSHQVWAPKVDPKADMGKVMWL